MFGWLEMASPILNWRELESSGVLSESKACKNIILKAGEDKAFEEGLRVPDSLPTWWHGLWLSC